MNTGDSTQLTHHQRRNRRWLATHPSAVTAFGALVFAAMGLGYGFLVQDEVDWLTPWVGAALGACFGAIIGYGMSAGARDPKPTGARRVILLVGTVLVVAAVIGMKYLRHTT